MKNIWSYITYVTSWLTLSPVGKEQQQILDNPDLNIIAVHNDVTVINVDHVVAPAVSDSIVSTANEPDHATTSDFDWSYPIFAPPTRKLKWAGSDFECEYPDMVGWEPCATETDRTCWLRNSTNYTEKFDISTDYEKYSPVGIVRNYTLVVEDGQWNADGLWAKDAKLINGTYPGPLIQACWGDTVRVKVINKLKHNGTAIHFHGVRQNQTMHMDGVPGITQCPIAPDDYFTYEFKVTQYGDSWYHSHYSVQYADGLLGPVTFHGPTSAHWDEPRAPILMSDWFHNSAFQVIHGKVPGYPTALLNGTGDVSKYEYEDRQKQKFRLAPNAPIPPKYTLQFTKREDGKPAKRYLLRLINTSFTTTFAFSIDGHRLTVVGTDFVPVKPLSNKTYLQIGIGQRYTVIVEAAPDPWWDSLGDRAFDQFWIRTTVVKCFRISAIGIAEYDKTGILRYDPKSLTLPSSQPWPNPPSECKDEIGFKPILEWNISRDLQMGLPANAKDETRPYGQEFSAHVNDTEFENKTYPLANWAFKPDGSKPLWDPMQVDYHDPFFLRLNNFDAKTWKAKWMVVPANYTEKDWVFVALTGMESREGQASSSGAHPIHLHGHDFAVLQVETRKAFDPQFFNFNFDNPLRRDVVLLPSFGWVVIAFKTDNPGSWIVHCHIAFHASEGLGFQINERQADANRLWPNPSPGPNVTYDSAIVEANRVCKRWRDFEDDCTRHWPGKNETLNCWPACTKKGQEMFACPPGKGIEHHVFQDDSGV